MHSIKDNSSTSSRRTSNSSRKIPPVAATKPATHRFQHRHCLYLVEGPHAGRGKEQQQRRRNAEAKRSQSRGYANAEALGSGCQLLALAAGRMLRQMHLHGLHGLHAEVRERQGERKGKALAASPEAR